MRIVETPVYDFTELSDAAKDKARAWFRETIDHDWWDSVYDDFEQICPILGVTLATTHRPPDGRRHPPEALHLVFRVLVAGRRRLFRGPLCLCPARVASHPRLCAPGHGAAPDRRRAAGAAEVELLPAHGLVPTDWPVLARLCDDVRRRPRQPCRPGDRRAHRATTWSTALRDLANWLYRALEREYEFQTSDETVDEGMSANGYTFTAEGRRFG